MNDKKGESSTFSRDQVSEAIRLACGTSFGVLDQSFLCQSLGALNPPSAVCVDANETLGSVVARLKAMRIGCVAVVNAAGKLAGIFSERDLVLKVAIGNADVLADPIAKYMTPEPVHAGVEMTLAYALNLMSQGGFRHIPLLDDNQVPVGMVSVKDVIDYIVKRMVDDLLGFSVDTN